MAKNSDLFDAIQKNSLRQLTLLLESGCDVNSRNGNSETPLMVALYRLRQKEQREKAVKQLLGAGADVNAKNGHGRTALTFACALDQTDSIRLLLQQDGIDVNLPDVTGVTSLMMSAGLGHQGAVSTLMELRRGDPSRLNVQAKDDSDLTALDYATISGNSSLADLIRGRSKSIPVGSKLPAGRFNNINNNRNIANNNNNKGGPKGKLPLKAAGEEKETGDGGMPTAVRDSNLPAIQQFGRDVKALQAQNDSNLASIPSSRPGSRSTVSSASSKGRLVQGPERAGSRGSVTRSKERPASRAASRARGSLTANEDDDDLDLDLGSLRELMGTVREAAKEIREIVEPLQKEKEKEAGARGEQKRRSRNGARHRNSGQRQQIQAEIHVISEINGRPVPPLPAAIPLIPSAPPAGADDPPASAYLHVENEELSHTWPRQTRGRSVSRERSTSSSGTLPAPGGDGVRTSPRPAEPQRVSPNAVKTEREILEKVVGRQHGGPDPLVAAINSSFYATPKSRLIMESRQRIVGMAREHWSTQQHPAASRPPPQSPPSQSQPLPHITVSNHEGQEGRGEASDSRSPPQRSEDDQGRSSPAEDAGDVGSGHRSTGGPVSPGLASPGGPQASPRPQQEDRPPNTLKPTAEQPTPTATPRLSPRPGPNSGPAPKNGPSPRPAPAPSNGPASRPGPNTRPKAATGGPNTGPAKPNGPASRPGPSNGPKAATGGPDTGPPHNGPATGPTNGPKADGAVSSQGSPSSPTKPVGRHGPGEKPSVSTGPAGRAAASNGAGGKQGGRPGAPAVGGTTKKAATAGGPARPGLRRAAP